MMMMLSLFLLPSYGVIVENRAHVVVDRCHDIALIGLELFVVDCCYWALLVNVFLTPLQSRLDQ